MKQKLGPRQLAWVEALEAHPERQTKKILGRKTTNKDVPYRACCLGEACLVKYRRTKRNNPWENNDITVGEHLNITTLLSSEERDYFGLIDNNGQIDLKYRFKKCFKKADSLVDANDNKNISWTKIAEFIRKYPQAVFKESK